MPDEEVVKTKDQLLAEMKTATDAMDWKAVSKVSSQIAKVVAAKEKEEKELRLAVLVEVEENIKTAIGKAVQRVIDALDTPTLELMDGVWYSHDFGEKLTACRLTKGAARKAGGGGGGGKKFSITTKELLDNHGTKLMGDTGKTFQQAYDEDTGGNSRYKVRMKLLKLEGLS